MGSEFLHQRFSYDFFNNCKSINSLEITVHVIDFFAKKNKKKPSSTTRKSFSKKKKNTTRKNKIIPFLNKLSLNLRSLYSGLSFLSLSLSLSLCVQCRGFTKVHAQCPALEVTRRLLRQRTAVNSYSPSSKSSSSTTTTSPNNNSNPKRQHSSSKGL